MTNRAVIEERLRRIRDENHRIPRRPYMVEVDPRYVGLLTFLCAVVAFALGTGLVWIVVR